MMIVKNKIKGHGSTPVLYSFLLNYYERIKDPMLTGSLDSEFPH